MIVLQLQQLFKWALYQLRLFQHIGPLDVLHTDGGFAVFDILHIIL